MDEIKANSVLQKLKQDNSEEAPMEVSKRNRKPGVAAPGLCDLPTELLQKIVSEVNIFDHSSIRATSTRMRDANDEFVMHEFKKVLHRQVNRSPTSYHSAMFKIIEYATEVYVRSGFASTFSGCILPILHYAFHDPTCPNSWQLDDFLFHFYTMVDSVGHTDTQRSSLLYNLTLMRILRFFKKFNRCVIISSTMIPLHWRVIVMLKGPWMGPLCRSNVVPDQSYHLAQRNSVLVMLAQVLRSNITGKSCRLIWECMNATYSLGNDARHRKRLPRLFFKITVYGSKKICELLRSCLEDPMDAFKWPAKWPNDRFTLRLDIISPEVRRRGGLKWQSIEIGPFKESEINSDSD